MTGIHPQADIASDRGGTGGRPATADGGHHDHDHDHAGHDHDAQEHGAHQHGAHEHGGHNHGAHSHAHALPSSNRAFAIGTALNIAMVAAELIFGFLSNSVALIADGFHNLSDVIGLLLAWGGAWLARRQPSESHTYGYRRASILAALANAALLLIATGGILWEAIQRIGEPQAVGGYTVMIVATIGILVNGGTALMFMRGRKDDLNMRGAFLHMASDAAVSIGVVIAALLIMLTGWHVLDPLIAIAIAVVIVISSWQLAKDSLGMAMDAVPAGVDYPGIRSYLASLPGVTEVHDLHVWAMSTTETALTAHLVRPGAGLDDAFLIGAQTALAQRFRVQHATLQLEAGDPAHPCPMAAAGTV
ncbi:cation diffusion facilitator family transporter [Chelatococcus reniformis]|uniref:Cobalt transporter n=1 Tax=Chelatococcus reniformis TaxID=1494448 RepID=A0A916UVQ0_9HYPH|nr:cation diffusion facilitator family transporter [Chelatococcus reniformis]GGC90843.1 cobalt transporter [Chelatococcus reniformis]